jgi:hypothetical protein
MFIRVHHCTRWSETSVYLNESTRGYIPKRNHALSQAITAVASDYVNELLRISCCLTLVTALHLL